MEKPKKLKRLRTINNIYYVGSGNDIQLAFKKLLSKIPKSEPYYGIIATAIDEIEPNKEFTMSDKFVRKMNELWQQYKKCEAPKIKIIGKLTDALFKADRDSLDKQFQLLSTEDMDSLFSEHTYLREHIEINRDINKSYYLLNKNEIKAIELLLWKNWKK